MNITNVILGTSEGLVVLPENGLDSLPGCVPIKRRVLHLIPSPDLS